MYKMLRLSVVLAVMALAVSPVHAALSDGLEGYWQFENNGTDSSGKGRDVAVVVPQGNVGYVGGLIGQAFNLPNDVNQYAARSVSDSAFDFGTGDFTIQAWVNYADVSGEQVLIEKFYNWKGPGWTLTKVSGNQYEFYAGGPFDTSALSIATNTWHQVLVRHGGGNLDVFFDGNSALSTPLSGVSDTTMPLLIGRRNDLDGRGFATDGKIDEVAIWSRAVTDPEVSELWNNGSGTAVPEPATLSLLGLGGLALLRRRK